MPIRISIPFQNTGKIELEGDYDEIKADIDHLKDIFEALGTEVGAIALAPPATITSPLSTGMPTETIPTIPTETKENLSEAIRFLINSDWGLAPRTLGSIMDALKQNAINRSKGAVSGTLVSLVKQNSIRRTMDTHKQQWVYSKF